MFWLIAMLVFLIVVYAVLVVIFSQDSKPVKKKKKEIENYFSPKETELDRKLNRIVMPYRRKRFR